MLPLLSFSGNSSIFFRFAVTGSHVFFESSLYARRVPNAGALVYRPNVEEPGSKLSVPLVSEGLTDCEELVVVTSVLAPVLVLYQPNRMVGVDADANTASGSMVTVPEPALTSRWMFTALLPDASGRVMLLS